nr:hypothetical protein [Priestia megaterium]MDH3186677.1 hypothetical protein [Priestia megaterium]
MYDVFSIKGEEKRKIPSQYQVVALGWELYQGRQLFTYSLESIWSFILDILSLKLLSIKQLVDLILKELNKESLPIDKPLSSLQDLFPLKRKRRELFLSKMVNDNLNVIERVWNPLLVLLEVYYRFRNRHDLKQIHIQFKELGEVNHLSLKRWEDDIKNYWNQPIKELIQYIIKSYILQQHAQVALNKVLSTGNDTYHFVENNGKLHFLKNNKPSYNVFRVNQAMTILEDLGEI